MLDEKGRAEDFAGPHQRVRDETEQHGKKPKKKKDDRNKIYGWRHYYVKPKMKDFEPGSSLARRMDNAPPPPPRRFKNATPGFIMLRLLREAHARGALKEIRADFSADRDSAGKKWSKKPKDTIDHKFKRGVTMLQAARWLEQHDFAEVRMQGRKLQMFRPDHGKTRNQIMLARGRNIVDAPKTGSSKDIATAAYVVSESGVHGWVSNRAAKKKWGRIEITHDVQNVRKWEVAENRGEKRLKKLDEPKHSHQYSVVPDKGANPYKQYEVGDYIYVLESGVPIRRRVRQISITWDNDGLAIIALTLSKKIESKAVRDHRRVRTLMGKTDSDSSFDDTPEGKISDEIAPEAPSGPSVQSRAGMVELAWDGKDVSGSEPIFDQDYVELHVGSEPDFEPDDLTLVNTFTSAGSTAVTMPDYETPYYAKMVAVDEGGDRSSPSDEVPFVMQQVNTGDIAPGAIGSDELDPELEVGSDGAPPAASPTPLVTPGNSVIYVRWAGIVNNDAVRYEVHVSATSGFTPDATTLLVDTTANLISARHLPDGTPFNYFVPDPTTGDPTDEIQKYFFRVIAYDVDGPADPSIEVEGWMDQTAATDIAVGTLVGELLAGELVLGSKIATPSLTGARVVLEPEGLSAYDSAEQITAQITTDGITPHNIRGELQAEALTVLNQMSIRGTINTMESGSVLTLVGTAQNPVAQPTATMNTWASVELNEDMFPDKKRGLYHVNGVFTVTNKALTSNVATLTIGTHSLSTGQNVTVAGVDATFNGTYALTGTTSTTISYAKTASNVTSVASGGTVTSQYHDHYFFAVTQGWSGNTPLGSTINEHDSAGVRIASYPILDATSDPVDAEGGITKLGSKWYALTYYKPDNEWWVYEYSGALSAVSNSPTDSWEYTFEPNGDRPTIGNDGTNLLICRVNTSNQIKIRKLVPSTGAEATSVVTSNFTVQGGSCDMAGVMKGAFDMGTSRYVISPRSSGIYNENWFVLQDESGSAGNRVSSAEWTIANSSELSGACYNSLTTRFVHLTDQDSPTKGKLVTYTNNWWTTSTDGTWHTSYTWRDSDAAGSGVHETYRSPIRKLTATKRAQLTVSSPNIPDLGGADDPDSMRVYVGHGTSTPTDANMFRAFTGTTGVITATMDAVAFSGSNLTNRDSGFDATSPSMIKDSVGQTLLASNGEYGTFHSGDLKPTARQSLTGGGAVVDFGWMKCDGSAFDQTTTGNGSLYAAIGSAFGTGGAGQSLVPDLRGRVAVGAGTFAALASNEGKTEANRGLGHTHAITSGGGHTHGINDTNHAGQSNSSGWSQTGGGLNVVQSVNGSQNGSHAHGGGTQSGGSHDHGADTGSGIGGSSVIGYVGIHWMIKI